MSFLVLLLAVWIEKFSALRQKVQRDGWWLARLARLESSPRMAGRPWSLLGLLVLLGLPPPWLVSLSGLGGIGRICRTVLVQRRPPPLRVVK